MNLTDVLQTPGKVMQKEEPLSLKEFSSRMGRFPITEKSPVSLTITNKGEKVLLIEGETALTVMIPCDRCLEDVPTPLQLKFEKEVDMKQTSQERIDALDESDYIDGYNLDVDRLVYGELLVNWPAKVLCREDCKGICNVCGQNLNHGVCGCTPTDLDPRMAKIRDIFSNYKEV